MVWSDESRYQLFRADGVCVRCRPHEAIDPSCQQGTVQAGDGSILVWGVFSWHGLGPVVHLNMSLSISLLGDHFQLVLDFIYPIKNLACFNF